MAGQSAAQYGQLQAAWASRFGSQSAIFNNINSALSPIMNAGPGQNGFTASENAGLRSNIINNTAASYRNASVVSAEGRAAAGGGNSFNPSGGDQEVQAQIASAAAGAESGGLNNLDITNKELGRQNFFNAESGLSNLANMENPVGLAQTSVGAGGQAFNEATKVQEMRNQKEAAIGGAIMSAATAGLGGFAAPAMGATSGMFNVASGIGMSQAKGMANSANQSFIGGLDTSMPIEGEMQ